MVLIFNNINKFNFARNYSNYDMNNKKIAMNSKFTK